MAATASEYKYYNITITNNGTKNLDQPAEIHINLTKYLLQDPSQYRMIIDKFSVDGEAIPLGLIELKNPQTIKTQDWETIHTVYIVNQSGAVGSAGVLFNSERLPNIPPAPYRTEGGMGYYTNTNPYFFIYTYTYMIRKINDALMNAYTQVFGDTSFPKFVYDPLTQLITLFAPRATFDSSLINPARIYISMSLLKYVGEGFAGPFVGANFIPGIPEPTKSYDITNNSISDPKSDATFLAIPQEYSAITSFSTINTILLTSTNLPIRQEFFPANQHPYELRGDESLASQYANLSAFRIISIFYPNTTSAGDYRGTIFYSSGSILDNDLIDLDRNTPLTEIHIQVFFTDNFNNVYPLTLIPGKSVNMRLAFVKK